MHIINSCNKNKIVVPDRSGDGEILAYQAIKQGWNVSFPEIGDCKDVDQAVRRFGKLYVIKSVLDNMCTGSKAKLLTKMHCK